MYAMYKRLPGLEDDELVIELQDSPEACVALLRGAYVDEDDRTIMLDEDGDSFYVVDEDGERAEF